MAEQSITQLFRQLDPLFVQKYGAQWKRATPPATVTPSVGAGAASTALNNHALLEYDEAHGTSATSARVHHSIHYGIVGGSTIDETANLSAMIDEVGVAGGGKIIVRAATNGNSIRLDGLAGIYHSNIDIEFQSPISAGAGGGVRAMGAMVEEVRNEPFAAGLDVDASVGDTTITLKPTAGKMQASDFLDGDLVTIRGENNAKGEALTKQILTIVSRDTGANTITFAEELEYDFLTIYPSSAKGATDATTIFLNKKWSLAADVARGAMTATVTDSTGMAVGKMVRLYDSRVEIDLNPAAIRSGGAGPYENECRLEYRIVTAIDSGTHTVTFDKPISKGYLQGSPYFGGIAEVAPVENVHIRGINLTYYEPQTDRNIHAISLNFAKDSTIEDCKVNGINGGMGQQYRISDSFNCWVYRSIGRDPMFHDSAEGYIFANYKSDSSGFRWCLGSGGRHNFLMQACTNFTVDSCQSYDGWINGIDTHGVDEWDGLITNCQMSQMNQHAPGVTTSMCGRNGNTSHTPGSHWVVWQNCVFYGNWETNSYGLDILAASTHITVDGCKFFGGDYGIRNSKNPSQCTPTQTAEYITISNCKFENIAVKPIYLEGIPDTAGGTRSSGKLNQVLLKNNEDWNCAQHIDVSGGNAITNLIVEKHTVVFPVTSPANNYYGLDLSDVNGLMVAENNFHLCSRGISLNNATNAVITLNRLTATVDAIPITLAGTNTGPGGGALIYVANIVDNTSAGGSGTAFTTDISVTNDQPNVYLIESDAGTDEKAWRIATSLGNFYLQALTDLLASPTTPVSIVRTGTTIDSINLTGATTITGTLNVTGGLIGASTAFTTDASVSNTQPKFDFVETDAATNEKVWRMVAAGGDFYIHAMTDVFGGAVNWLLVTRTGTTVDAITLTATAINLAGALAAAADTDTTHALGRARVGFVSGLSDYATFAHYDRNTSTGYAIAHGPGGDLYFNAATGQVIAFRINNAYVGEVGASGIVSTTVVAAGANTDNTSVLGRARVGFISGLSDYASFAHYDHNTSTNYSLLQGPSGDTFVNAASGQSIALRINNATVGVVSATGLAVTGDLSVSGSITRNGSGFRYFYDENAITFGVSAIDILPDATGRARGVMIYGFATNSGGGVAEIRQMVSSGLPSNTVIGTDTLRITCTGGGRVSIVHYAHTGGSPQGTFSVAIDIYWAND